MPFLYNHRDYRHALRLCIYMYIYIYEIYLLFKPIDDIMQFNPYDGCACVRTYHIEYIVNAIKDNIILLR